eukprot:365573_1
MFKHGANKKRTTLSQFTHYGWILVVVVGLFFLYRLFGQIHTGYASYSQMVDDFFDPFNGYQNDTKYDKYIIKSPSVYSSDDNDLTLIIFTVTNKIRPACNLMRVNTYSYNNSLNYLGLKHPAMTRHASHLYKITTMYHQLKYLYNDAQFDNDKTIILGVDAFDVFIQSPPQVLLSRYLNVLRQQNETHSANVIVFSGEHNCYPCDESMKNEYNSEIYLNSGSWMSSIRTQYKLFEKVIQYDLNNMNEEKEILNSDQYVFHKLYLNQKNDGDVKIVLDQKSILFRTTFMAGSDSEKFVQYLNKDNQCPSVLHFNSPHQKKRLQQHLKAIRREMGSAFYRNDYHQEINTNLGQVTVNSLCHR